MTIPTIPRTVTLELLSDTTFARGEGTAGEVDVEVEHDELGLPLVGGKTLHGLLRDAWLSMAPAFPALAQAARTVLGPGQDLAETCRLRIGDAVIEDATRQWILAACTRQHHPVSPAEVLRALTDVRRQTAQDRKTGAPAGTTLRAVRVTTRGLTFHAPLAWLDSPSSDETRCLALCLLGVRNAGLSRNRGRGHVSLYFDGDWEATARLARGVSA